MTVDLYVWQAGSSLHYLGQMRSSRSLIKVHGHRRKNVAKVIGVTSCEGFLAACISGLIERRGVHNISECLDYNICVVFLL